MPRPWTTHKKMDKPIRKSLFRTAYPIFLKMDIVALLQRIAAIAHHPSEVDELIEQNAV